MNAPLRKTKRLAEHPDMCSQLCEKRSLQAYLLYSEVPKVSWTLLNSVPLGKSVVTRVLFCSLLRSIGEWACALAKNEVMTHRQRLSRQVLLLQLCNGEQTHCRMGYGRQREASSCRKGGGFPKDVTSRFWMCQLAAVEAFLCPAETWTAHIIAESEARKVGTSSAAFFTSPPAIPVMWDTSTSLQCGPIPFS